MAYILKRPMFRRGGSAADGVGITSGLKPRKKYAEAGLANEYDAAVDFDWNASVPDTNLNIGNQNKNIVTSSNQDLQGKKYSDLLKFIAMAGGKLGGYPGQNYDDLLLGFGSSGADIPAGQPQTWGQAIGKAVQVAGGLRKQREQQQAQFEAQAALAGIKNMLEPTNKDQLFRYAQEYARIKGIPENQRSAEDQATFVFLQKQLKGIEPKMNWQKYESDLETVLVKKKPDGFGYDSDQATRIARTKRIIMERNLEAAKYGPKDGKYDSLPEGRYIDPNTGKIILWNPTYKTKTEIPL